MPAARAFSIVCSLSSNATTSAPPASSALALASPEAPRPNSATFFLAKLVSGIIAAPLLPSPRERSEWWGGEHTAYAARSSSQLQGREAGKRQHDRDDPEPDHDLRLGPAFLLEVVMQRSHAEHALARQ